MTPSSIEDADHVDASSFVPSAACSGLERLGTYPVGGVHLVAGAELRGSELCETAFAEAVGAAGELLLLGS